MNPNILPPDRREFLLRGGAGFGATVLTYLLGTDPLFAKEPGPLAPRQRTLGRVRPF